MGVQQSTESSVSGRGQEGTCQDDSNLGVIPLAKSEIKLREGNKTEPIPSPHNSEQSLYNLILQRDDFKTHCTYANAFIHSTLCACHT